MSNGKPWLPSHTALMVYYAGKGWPNWRIARALGFTRKAVQERRSLLGFDNCWQAREGLRESLTGITDIMRGAESA